MTALCQTLSAYKAKAGIRSLIIVMWTWKAVTRKPSLCTYCMMREIIQHCSHSETVSCSGNVFSFFAFTGHRIRRSNLPVQNLVGRTVFILYINHKPACVECTRKRALAWKRSQYITHNTDVIMKLYGDIRAMQNKFALSNVQKCDFSIWQFYYVNGKGREIHRLFQSPRRRDLSPVIKTE